jgi:hypothetical protein
VNSNTSNIVLINIQGNYSPFKGFNLNFNYAPKFYSDFVSNNSRRVEYFNVDTKALLFSNPNKNTLSNGHTNALTNYLKVQATYNKSFKFIDLDALAGAEQTDNRISQPPAN